MNKNEQGLILLHTLLMISLLALLIMTQLHSIHLYLQSERHLAIQQQTFQKLEQEARRLANLEFEKHSEICFVNDNHSDKDQGNRNLNANEVIRLLRAGGGCISSQNDKGGVNDIDKDLEGVTRPLQFRYFIENLGVFPCLETLIANTRYNTHHWRVSVINTGTSATAMIIQARIVKTGKPSHCKSGRVNYFPLGTVSWRILND